MRTNWKLVLLVALWFLSENFLHFGFSLAHAEIPASATCAQALSGQFDHRGFTWSDLFDQYVPGKRGRLSYWVQRLGHLPMDGETLSVTRFGNQDFVMRLKNGRIVWEFYAISDRSLFEVKGYYRKDFFDLNSLRGLTLLDIGTGRGRAVKELTALLQKHKIPARIFGSDIDLTEEQKQDPQFIESDSLHLPFADSELDIIQSTWSVFSYEQHSNPELLVKILREAHRVLKPGGVVRLSPIDLDVMNEIVKQAGGFEVSRSGRIIPTRFDSRTIIPWGHYLEIRKVK